MKLGDTILWCPRGRIPHLYIALNDPEKAAGKIVLVNITGSNGGEMAMILKPSDHPFIYKNSDVNFGDAICGLVSAVDNEIRAGNAIANEPMNMEIVERIAKAAITHPACTREVQKVLKAYWP